MKFKKGELFHVYNQGNNRQKLFFNEENYEYFIDKIKTYVLPYADVLAWCLMPNHFHLMLHIRKLESEINLEPTTKTERIKKQGENRSFNQSIGIALRSYARGINREQNRSGSLFRNNTKAVEITSLKGLMPTLSSTKNIQFLTSVLEDKQYPQICFNYIHLNPIRAKMVKISTDWKYSSAQDFAKIREPSITNIDVAKQFVTVN